MVTYSVVFKASVEKDLRSLPRSVVTRVFKLVEELKDEPIPRQAIKLTGAEQLYRLRVGNYRVIYGVDTESKQIMVHHVRHRRDVYRQL
jgi:mRNA interferase RelE/StbE